MGVLATSVFLIAGAVGLFLFVKRAISARPVRLVLPPPPKIEIPKADTPTIATPDEPPKTEMAPPSLKVASEKPTLNVPSPMQPPRARQRKPPNMETALRAESSPAMLRLPPQMTKKPPKPSRQVVLTPGHSPLDWAILQKSGQNLRGIPQGMFLRVPKEELRLHNKRNDAWTVLGGRVYNITPYMPFHPGGENELMRAAGRDGTKLFQEFHPWINWDNMLNECMIGIYVGVE